MLEIKLICILYTMTWHTTWLHFRRDLHLFYIKAIPCNMITCMQVKMTSLTKPLSLSPGVTYNVVHWTSWPAPFFIPGLSRREGRYQAEVQELRRRPMVGGCKWLICGFGVLWLSISIQAFQCALNQKSCTTEFNNKEYELSFLFYIWLDENSLNDWCCRSHCVQWDMVT